MPRLKVGVGRKKDRMKRLFFFVALAGLGWYGFNQQRERNPDADGDFEESFMPVASTQPNETFQCDGRTHCSQMTSCAEATFFIRNCPGTKMDGNNDGVPCESQWCR